MPVNYEVMALFVVTEGSAQYNHPLTGKWWEERLLCSQQIGKQSAGPDACSQRSGYWKSSS